MPSFLNSPALPVPMRDADRVKVERDGKLYEFALGDFLAALGGGRQVVTGTQDKYRDSFTSLNPENWTHAVSNAHDSISFGGTSHGAGFARISGSFDKSGTRTLLRGKRNFSPPYRSSFGVSISQRISNEITILRHCAVDENGNTITVQGESTDVVGPVITTVSRLVIASNMAVIVFNGKHNLKPGEFFVLSSPNGDSRFAHLFQVSSLRTEFTLNAIMTASSGEYVIGAGAEARKIDFCAGARDCLGLAFLGADSSLSIWFSRADGGPALISIGNIGTDTTGNSSVANIPFNVSTQPRFALQFIHQADLIRVGAVAIDSGSVAGFWKRTQSIPNPGLEYNQEIDFVRLPNASRVIQIASVQKTGSTTATITTTEPHGLTGSPYGRLYGYNTTSLPNVTTDTLLTVVNPNTLRAVWGTGDTSLVGSGGSIVLVSGLGMATGALATAVRAYAWSGDVLYLGTNSQVSLVNGDVISVTGTGNPTVDNRRFEVLANAPNVLRAGAVSFVNGSPNLSITDTSAIAIGMTLSSSGNIAASIINSVSSNSAAASVNAVASNAGALELSLQGFALRALDGAPTPDSKSAVAINGALFRHTDVRLHFATLLDHTRILTEVSSGHVTNDENTSVPTRAVGTVTMAEGSILAPTNSNAVTSASTNATALKSSSGTVFNITISNLSASPVSFKLYNKSSTPTVGTDVPLLCITVAAGSTESRNFGRLGKRCSSGIAYAVTANPAISDTTAASAGAILNIDFV